MNSTNFSPINKGFNSPPVLFLIFNRPDTTKLVFERIREAKPQRLYIAADGPRIDHPTDTEKCEEARSIVELVDWECGVKTLFREENLGCGRAVKSAIDWFFDDEEAGIILEDDCLADPSFFSFCEELLNKYANDEKIGLISGDQFVKTSDLKTSYYFTNFPHIWGWATWKRVWTNYDFNMKDWPAVRQTLLLREKTGSTYYASKLQKKFDQTFEGKIDTWDYQLYFMIWVKNQLGIAPKINLISNIGFGANATHTVNPKDAENFQIPTSKLLFPLTHPVRLKRNLSRDMSYLKLTYGTRKPAIKRIIKYLRKYLSKLKAIVNKNLLQN